jgi:hypothetical protein
MAVRIHQLLAVIGGAKAEADAALTRLTAVAHNENLMDGMEKTSRLASEDAGQDSSRPRRRATPPQVKKVAYTAAQVLDSAEKLLTPQWDLALTLDAAQGAAAADVTLPDGEVLLHAVPVRHLVYLEGELGRLTALVAGIPVQDGTQEWTTENAPPGQWKSRPQEGDRKEKVPFNWHRGNGTDKFQEQVDVMTRDEVAEYTSTVNYTGRLPADRKAQLLDRLSALRTAVKMAREEANSAQAVQLKEGADVFAWLLRP